MKKIEEKPKKERYFEATGGRKTAAARARLFTKGTGISVNEKDFKDYFRMPRHQIVVQEPLESMKVGDKLKASVKVSGGGINAQAEAVRNAIAKALVKFNVDFKKRLRRAGFITRDSRMVERKKYGLKKARRAPQWAKR
ncbi:MAG TPA: 30S ribosomal protein S9 [Candidatus Paceibacterota bacterium]